MQAALLMEAADATSLDLDDVCLSEAGIILGGGPKTLATPPLPNHLAQNSTLDSGVHSQQSLNKSVKIEILQPEVKELLSNCAQYNLEQIKDKNGAGDSRSAQVLEEIRHAEALEQQKREKVIVFFSWKCKMGRKTPRPITQ